VSRRLRLLLGIAISAVCVWWAMREVRPAEVWAALVRADYRGFVGVMLLTLAAFWIRAFRWRWLLSTTRPVGLGSLFSATMIGFMANNLLPLRLGEFVRAWALARRESFSKTTVFATVVVERVVDMITLLGIFGITLLLHPISASTEAGRLTNAGARVLVAACVGLTLFLVVMERMPGPLRAAVRWISARLPERLGSRGTAAFDHFLEGLGLFRDLARLLWVLVLSFVMFGAFALALQVSMWALHIGVPWYGGMLMLVITAIGIMVPAAPGYIGTMNLACVAGLALYYLRREGLSLRSLGRVQEDVA
jgi:uncharacterized protein (TIRG00374 family)